MPITQFCQSPLSQNYFENFFRTIRVESLESLNSLDDSALVNLLNMWFCYKDLPQTESCNFTSSLFADASMDITTLNRREGLLNDIIKRIDLLHGTGLLCGSKVGEYSREIMRLVMLDNVFWRCIHSGEFNTAIFYLQILKKDSEEILPYRTENYSNQIRTYEAKLSERRRITNGIVRPRGSEIATRNVRPRGSEIATRNVRPHGEQPDEDEMS